MIKQNNSMITYNIEEKLNSIVRAALKRKIKNFYLSQ